MKIGTKVVRGPDWEWDNQDGMCLNWTLAEMCNLFEPLKSCRWVDGNLQHVWELKLHAAIGVTNFLGSSGSFWLM